MQIGKVIGTVVSSVKQDTLVGLTLLIVQPLSPEHEPAGPPIVAVDSVGAGVGEAIFFVRGREASLPFLPTPVPTDACIVGSIDVVSVTRDRPRRQDAGDQPPVSGREPRRATAVGRGRSRPGTGRPKSKA